MSASETPSTRTLVRLERERETAGSALRAPGEPSVHGPRSAPTEIGRAARRALLVIGMHRSGTSAFTRVLSLSGAKLPGHLMPAGERNPRGYFESQRIYELHEQLLAEAGTAWDDLSPFPREWLDSPVAPRWIERMAEAVRSEFGDSPLVTLKDPRIARLVPFWLRVLARLGIEPAFLLPVRNPLDVAASLGRAEGIVESKALLLWLQHLLTAEHDTRGQRRSFVGYEELLRDWRSVVAKISSDLGLVFPRVTRRAAAEIDDFLAQELQHHATSAAEVTLRRSVPAWVKGAFEWARLAAAGEPSSSDALDALDSVVRPAELAFGPVVASLEVARRDLAERAALLEADAERVAAELGNARSRLAASELEAARAHDELTLQQEQTTQMVDWVKTLLSWASRAIHDDEATSEHLDVVFEAIDAASPRGVPQLATTGLRLAQQSAEAARFAEESDLRAAESERLGRELAALREELSHKATELARIAPAAVAQAAELAVLRTDLARVSQDREQVQQQVRGLWQQISARDGEFARLRREAAAREAELARLGGELAALRRDVTVSEAALAKLSDTLEHERREASASVAERDLHITGLRARLLGIEGSRIWRAARPLRWLAEGAGALFKG